MSNRDMLYRSVLRPGSTSASESPIMSRDLSPMSNLALSFHHTASITTLTPRRKLSLSSSISESPLSIHNLSLPSSTCSILHDSLSSDFLDASHLMSPTRTRKKSENEKENVPSICHEETTLMSPPAAPSSTCLFSPTRRMLARDKENFPSPYFSPSHSSHIPHRPRSSPLQEVQNTVNRNLNFSPVKKKLQMISPSKTSLSSPKFSPPEDFDTNSQDSGYSESGKKFDNTCFSVPVSCAPRKLNLDLSPPKVLSEIVSSKMITSNSTSRPVVSATASSERKPFKKFLSGSKCDEEDSMLMDLMNDEAADQEDQHPLGFATLLSAPIQRTSSPQDLSSSTERPTIKRCLSMMDITPTSSRVESVLSDNKMCMTKYGRFKRPEAPSDLSGLVECKRRREDEGGRLMLNFSAANLQTATKTGISPLTLRQVSAPEASSTTTCKPKFVRSHSESHVSIMKALNKCSNHNGELTGDFSKPIALPTIEGGKHPDLRAVSVDTMADLLRGKYSKDIQSFKILDCRYPYEFEGGHIEGAEMFHHPQMVIDHLTAQKGAPSIDKEETPRHILIFHCEFSAERGPKAQRLLRERDRATNKEHYPALHFPETYLLEGGYKAFFEKYPELCTPHSYVRMLDSNHADDLKHFRGKSKSWQAESKQAKSRNNLTRPGFKRLGL